MAQYGLIYRLQWNTIPSYLSTSITVPAQAMEVNIFDTETLIEDSDTPEIIDLQPDANPLIIKIINNDEDKFTPIRAKQAIVKFQSDANQFEDTLTFVDSSDNRWYMEATADGEFIFKGFLMISDIQQNHLPDPNTVILTFSDHLALLKDITLVTDAGINPSGKLKIGEIIALCLKQTGLRLDIVVINNLRHGTGSISTFSGATFSSSDNSIIVDFYIGYFYVGQRITISGSASNNITTTVTEIVSSTKIIVSSTLVNEVAVIYNITFTDDSTGGHFYDKIYMDALSFEKEIGISEDCNTILEKILGEDCFLTQWKAKWYIMRINEYDDNPIYEANFDVNGLFQSFNSATTYAKSVGATETRRLANADALRRYDRPPAYIKEIFDLIYPQEIPCNVDYVRGDQTSDATVQRTGYTSYELDCWTPGRKWGSLLDVPTFTPAIMRAFTNFGDESQRFIMLSKPASSTGAFEYIRSEAIPISFGDEFTWRFEARAMTDTAGDGFNLVCIILLYGNDGSVYILRNRNLGVVWDQTLTDVQTQWKLTNTDVSLFQDGLQWAIYDNANFPKKTEWTSFEMVAAPIPVDGNIYIHLFSANQQAGTFDDFDINYQNLQFEYHASIGGTFSKYTKFHNKVTRDPIGYFNSIREKSVYIQDSPKPIFKGSMFFRAKDRLLFSGSITFASPNSINVSGYKLITFFIGQKIVLTGTNAGEYSVTDVIYHIIGNTTEIQVNGSISTVTESATISEFTFNLTQLWYNSAPVALGNPANITDCNHYGYLQSYSVWNQFKNGNRILSTSVLGLGSMWPDALDKWSITDSNPHVNNRYFLLISFEQNWKTALWSGVFIEDYRTDLGKVYTDTHEFKYLTK